VLTVSTVTLAHQDWFSVALVANRAARASAGKWDFHKSSKRRMDANKDELIGLIRFGLHSDSCPIPVHSWLSSPAEPSGLARTTVYPSGIAQPDFPMSSQSPLLPLGVACDQPLIHDASEQTPRSQCSNQMLTRGRNSSRTILPSFTV